MRGFVVGLAVALTVVMSLAAPVAAQSRHENYYYPKVSSREVYVARARTFEDASRSRRLEFVNGMTQTLSQLPYPPPFAIFAKGDDAEKMIIVGLSEGSFNTLFRVRALVANLTAYARSAPLFKEYQVDELFTFYDLAKLLGFDRITVSDGARFAHQVTLQ
jgi:hypothetical protein